MLKTITIERTISSRREIEKGIFGRIKKDVTNEFVTERIRVVHNDQELKNTLPQTVTNALPAGDQSRSSRKTISPPKSKRPKSKRPKSKRPKSKRPKSKKQQPNNQGNMKLPNYKHHVGKKRMHA